MARESLIDMKCREPTVTKEELLVKCRQTIARRNGDRRCIEKTGHDAIEGIRAKKEWLERFRMGKLV